MADQDIHARLSEIFGKQWSSVVFECGPHVGTDTIRMLNGFLFPRMFVFEPDPRNIQILKKQGLQHHIMLVEAAVGAQDGKATFYLSSGVPPFAPATPANAWSGSSSLRRPKKHLKQDPWCKFDHQITVDVVTLDTVCSRYAIDHVDLIWADIQGAEGDMVRGAQNILRHTRYFYVEYYNDEMFEGEVNLNQLIDLLPGKWETVHDFGTDVSLRNVDYASPTPPIGNTPSPQ